MSTFLVGDFVQLDRGLCVVVDQQTASAGEGPSRGWITVLDEGGNSHTFGLGATELSDGTWTEPLQPAEPGKARGPLNKLLKKWRRRHGKAV